MPGGATWADLAAAVQKRSQRDPEFRLDVTREFTSADNPIDTDAEFTDRTKPITFALSLTRDDAASNGLLFEFGGTTLGVAAYLDSSGNLGFVAGGAGDNGFTMTASAGLSTVGQVYRCVFAVLTGNGKGRMWIDGRIVARAQAVNEGFGGGWGGLNDGAIGAIGGSQVSGRVPVGQQAGLTNATIIGPVRCYDGVIPVTGGW